MTTRTKRAAGFKKLYGKPAKRKKGKKTARSKKEDVYIAAILTLDEFVSAWAAAQEKGPSAPRPPFP